MVCPAELAAELEAVLVGEKRSAAGPSCWGPWRTQLRGPCPFPGGICLPHPHLGFRIRKPRPPAADLPGS